MNEHAPTAADDVFPRPIASVDLAIFALSDEGLDVLLAKRASDPFAGEWALPGGWIHPDTDVNLDAAAGRVLMEKTGVETPYLEQLQSFGNGWRDPRGWSLSVAYMALVGASEDKLLPGVNTTEVRWWPIVNEDVTPRLPFDHAEILKVALRRLRGKVEYSNLPAHLLPERFTLSELQSVYERILGRKLDKSAFRKRVAEADFVEAVPGEMRRASNRPAQIYRLKQPRETVLFDRTI